MGTPSHCIRRGFLETPPALLAAHWLASRAPGLRPGNRVGRYEVRQLVCAGGMGEVYQAVDARSGRPAALKVLARHLAGDAGAVRRFEQEFRAGSLLRHPNLISVLEGGRSEAGPYIAMEWVEGRNLREVLAANAGGVSVESAATWVSQAARGLAAAHARRVVHRDIKPENVMVSRGGAVKILDFGLARLPGAVMGRVDATGSSGTISGTLSGTPRYMAPEVLRGERATPASDVFALGIVLYELLTGRHPMPTEWSMPSTVPEWLDRLVAAMLDRDPSARATSLHVAVQLANALHL